MEFNALGLRVTLCENGFIQVRTLFQGKGQDTLIQWTGTGWEVKRTREIDKDAPPALLGLGLGPKTCSFTTRPDPAFPGTNMLNVPSIAWCETHNRPASQCGATTVYGPDEC
jgi:hypothetical protein